MKHNWGIGKLTGDEFPKRREKLSGEKRNRLPNETANLEQNKILLLIERGEELPIILKAYVASSVANFARYSGPPDASAGRTKLGNQGSDTTRAPICWKSHDDRAPR